MLIINISNIIYAAPQEVSAEGTYRLGDNDTRDNAKKYALADAKRKIIEQVGVLVESYTEVNNFKITKDQIKSATSAIIKVKSEQVDFYENGTLCKAFVIATVDTDNIEKYLKENPQPTNNTKLYGYEKLNGHCYKVFNEGLSWDNARIYCEEMGGHLVTITSFSEQSFIEGLITIQGKRNNYWIGGFRNSSNRWCWVTGENFSYSNWAINQPDNYYMEQNKIIIMDKIHEGHFGEWDDLGGVGTPPRYGREKFGFICEWESEESIRN